MYVCVCVCVCVRVRACVRFMECLVCVFAPHVLCYPVSDSHSLCNLVQVCLVNSLVIVCIFMVLSIQLVFVGS